jgi:hypothetical protein
MNESADTTTILAVLRYLWNRQPMDKNFWMYTCTYVLARTHLYMKENPPQNRLPYKSPLHREDSKNPTSEKGFKLELKGSN